MAQQTINVGTAPNDGTGTPLRTAFQYTNSNFSELYTAVGPSGNNIVVPGNATITGDLTVDTSTLKVDSGANKVGVGTTTMNGVLTVKNTSVLSDIPIYTIQGATNTAQLASWTINQNTDVISFGTDYGGALSLKTNSTERYRLASDGVATWSNVGGVAGTAMTLNSTGLGVGGSPSYKLDVQGTSAGVLRLVNILNLSTDPAAVTRLSLDGQGATWHLDNERTNGIFKITRNSTACLTIDNSANVGIGVTPSAKFDVGLTGAGTPRIKFTSASDNPIIETQRYSGVASDYYGERIITGGGFFFQSAPAAAVGSQTFTTRMSLDASGRLILLASTTTPATLSTNGQLTMTATSDTNLRFSYRGSDGVTRVANLTLA